MEGGFIEASVAWPGLEGSSCSLHPGGRLPFHHKNPETKVGRRKRNCSWWYVQYEVERCGMDQSLEIKHGR
jgi:hypothetical protein